MGWAREIVSRDRNPRFPEFPLTRIKNCGKPTDNDLKSLKISVFGHLDGYYGLISDLPLSWANVMFKGIMPKYGLFVNMDGKGLAKAQKCDHMSQNLSIGEAGQCADIGHS